MSRPIGCLFCSCWRTFPKNSKLSLISSLYLTLPPNCLLKSLRTFLSMYSGQLANVQLPISVFGWLTLLAASSLSSLAFSASPSTPPQAARTAARPLSARPELPARPMKPRLDRRSLSKNSSRARSIRGSLNALLLGYDEGVVGIPGQVDLAAGPERVRFRAVEVLGEDGQLLAARRLDHVLDRGAEEGGDDDSAAQGVAVTVPGAVGGA